MLLRANLCFLYLKLRSRWNTLTELERNLVGRHNLTIARMPNIFGQWLYDTHSWGVKDNFALWAPPFLRMEPGLAIRN